MKIEKVVGTTFTKNTLDTFGFTALKPYHVPKRKFEAQIVPEIENAYDNKAKRVDVFYDGKPIKVGYLSKDGDLYSKFKRLTRKIIPCTVTIKGYSNVGYNDSYEVAIDSQYDRNW